MTAPNVSDESTSGDTSAEVERIRAWHADRRGGARYATIGTLLARIDALTAERDALAARLISDEDETAEDRAADIGYMVRASERLPHHMIDVHAGDVVRWLREIAAARARLPSPESVTRARLVAAEIVDVAIAEETVMPADTFDGHGWGNGPPDWRAIANACAAVLRDRARTHSGRHDEGGDVDAATLRECAEDVDGCTTLGELEGLVAKWREVRT